MSNTAPEANDPRANVRQGEEGAAMRSASDEGTFADEDRGRTANGGLTVDTSTNRSLKAEPSPSAIREHSLRLDDELAVLEAERVVSNNTHREDAKSEKSSLHRSRSSRRSEPVDEFDAATNPLHEKAAVYNPPDNPTTSLARALKKIHSSSFLVRYIIYIIPVVGLILIPLLLGSLVFPNATVGDVKLMWFSIWLEIFWLTLWAGRLVAKCIPYVLGMIMSIFTNNPKKWRDLGSQLQMPATLFFWWLGVEISFLPTMVNHHIDGSKRVRHWEMVMNKVIVSIFVGVILNLVEKLIIQLIAISFHTRTYADRIEINKFQIGSLAKLYAYSREVLSLKDEDFEEKSSEKEGTKTPLNYASAATKVARKTLNKVGDMAGAVAGDFTGKKVAKSTHPQQVVLTLLGSTSGSQVLARRLYRTFVREGFDTVFAGDLKAAFDNSEEADAAFAMFDKDMNGDISMEELEAVCVEIGRERKSITASLKDLDSVVSKLDSVLFFIVCVITILVFLSLISTSAAGVLTSAGSTILALSWLFSATAQEFLQSVVFVFIKHPFDVGDRVTVYGTTGDNLTGDDYYVKKISLLYTEFKKMQGHVVQAPNSYLNTLFILNQRRSGALAEAVPVVLKFGTTLEQIETLRQRLLEFVRSEKREYQPNILTELRDVTEAYSITLNVVFFYKSNWQNEGLRLQRRNKFICMLMLSMQEIGIEGPRKNMQGAHVDYPYHVAYHGLPPSYSVATSGQHDNSRPPTVESSSATRPTTIAEERGEIPENSSISTGMAPSQQPQQHHSILRKGSTVAAARARGESTSRPGRHVDFSLGMTEMSSGDVMGDVFEGRGPSRLEEVVRTANRESEERRARVEEERASVTSGMRRVRTGSHSSSVVSPRAHGGLLEPESSGVPRSSLESRNSARPSFSSSLHRSRFLGRPSTEARREDLEQGQFNPGRNGPN